MELHAGYVVSQVNICLVQAETLEILVELG